MSPAGKLDLHRLHAAEYVAPRSPWIIATKPARYLTIRGSGDPAGAGFRARVVALYAVAFAVKTARKKARQDFKVGYLEGLWYGLGAAGRRARAAWRWKLLIRVPDFVGAKEVAAAARALVAKGKAPAVRAVKLERIAEGRCVQMLHVGPYTAEGTTMGAMATQAKAQGLRLAGAHHEIYLSAPGRTSPARLRTILRHPVR